MQVNDVGCDQLFLFEDDDLSKEYARKLDEEDPLRHFRDEFLIPSKADLKSKTLPGGMYFITVEVCTDLQLNLPDQFLRRT
jgi:hypothetical protein